MELKHSVKNLNLVDGCIIASEVTEGGLKLCRFVPRLKGSNEFCKEISQISGCDILLQSTKEGLCFGFDLKKKCFVSFTLKKALVNHLENNQGEITENLKYINFTNPPVFNGFFMDEESK